MTLFEAQCLLALIQEQTPRKKAVIKPLDGGDYVIYFPVGRVYIWNAEDWKRWQLLNAIPEPEKVEASA